MYTIARIFIIFVSCIFTTAFCCFADIPLVTNAAFPEGYCAHVFATNLASPRHIVTMTSGEVMVSSKNNIILLWDDNKNGVSDPTERVTLATYSGLTGEINYYGGYIYASTTGVVVRWSYPTVVRTPITSGAQVVITGIETGGHSTRPMQFDATGLMYVGIGSGSNVDSSPSRALIRRFNITQTLPITWSTGEIYAFGMRNEVGLRFDIDGTLHGVENGVDDLSRSPWGDIHNNNPAEEMNNFGNPQSTPAGKFYGYPYCWSEYSIAGGKGAKTQWAHPNFLNKQVTFNGNQVTITDAWCQNTTNVVPPTLAMPAHVAPLDILFYYGNLFPNVSAGDAFVSWHGSWDRDDPQGYKVVHVSFQNGSPKAWRPVFYYNKVGVDTDSGWPYRPVGLAVGKCEDSNECLFISSDSNGQIVTLVPQNGSCCMTPLPSSGSSSFTFSLFILACMTAIALI